MIRIVNPFLATQKARAIHSAHAEERVRLTPADRAVLGLFVCLLIAVAGGSAVGMFVSVVGNVRIAAAAGGAVFGVVLGTLMVWRACIGR